MYSSMLYKRLKGGANQILTPQVLTRASGFVGDSIYHAGKRAYDDYFNSPSPPSSNPNFRSKWNQASPRRVFATPKSRMGNQAPRSAERMTQVKSKIRRVGATNSRSAGRFRRPRARAKSGKRFQRAKQGVVYNTEHGTLVQAGFTQYIGHHSVPIEMAKAAVFAAIVKRIQEVAGMSYTSQEDVFMGGKQCNIIVTTQTSPGVAEVDTTIAIPAASTINFAIGLLRSTTLAFFAENEDATLQRLVVQMVSFNYQPVILHFKESKVSIYSKSTLKIQNRSKNALGTEADEVDNVPLYGKSYQGIGNGTSHIRDTSSHFLASAATGLIAYSANAANEEYYKEPPFGYEFRDVKRTGKARLEPGEIKTSLLITSKTLLLNKFLQQLVNSGSITLIKPRFPAVGEFRFFGLEKMLETSADPTPILVAAEHNTRMSISVSTPRPHFQVSNNSWTGI